jgi:hypothetical protein
MCLYAKTNDPIVAKTDIHGYKIVIEYHDKIFNTPYQWEHIPLDVIEGNERFVARWNKNEKKSEGIIKSGYIHIFSDEDYAWDCALDIDIEFTVTNPQYFIHVLDVIIPKGTLFYEDLLGREYAAEEILFLGNIDYSKRVPASEPARLYKMNIEKREQNI